MRRGYTGTIRESGGGGVGCIGAIVLLVLTGLMTVGFVYLVSGMLRDVGGM